MPEKLSFDLEDDDPVARRQVKRALERSSGKAKKPSKPESKRRKVKEAQEQVAAAQVASISKKDKIPLTERGFVTRDPVTNELVPLKSAAGYQVPASQQPGFPAEMQASHEEGFWLRFMHMVAVCCGNVTKACKEMNIDRGEVLLRQRQDPVFRLKMEEARKEGVEMAEDEVVRRAVDGVEKPVGFYKGSPSAYETVYSDSLLMFLLKGAKPEKYAERSKNENLNLNAELDKEELEHAKKLIYMKLAGKDDEDNAPVIEAEVASTEGQEPPTPALDAPPVVTAVTNWGEAEED